MKYFTIFIMYAFLQSAYANDSGLLESSTANEKITKIESEVALQLQNLKALEKRLIKEENKNQSISEKVTATKSSIENIKEHVEGLRISLDSSDKSLKSIADNFDVVSSVLKEVLSSTEIQGSVSRNIYTDLNRTSIYRDWVQPIILSIIAAVIFWFFFSYLREKRRTLQIRKTVDTKLFQIYNNLFTIFDMVLRPNSYSPSFEQQKIRSGNLTEEDIFLGLQNKCLNETYYYDKNLVQALNPIGKKLHKLYSSIGNKIELIFHFSSCLSPHEILLLDRISIILSVYGLDDYDRSAGSVVAGKTLYALNPSISYMTKNLFELYEKTIIIQSIVLDGSFDSREAFINKLMFEFNNNNLKKCVKLINKNMKKYQKDISFLNIYLFICQLEMNQTDSARKTLKIVMKNKPNLVSNRNFFQDYINNENVSDIFKENYSEQETLDMNNCLDQEARAKSSYVASANALIEYYKNKSANNST